MILTGQTCSHAIKIECETLILSQNSYQQLHDDCCYEGLQLQHLDDTAD